jgi:hypothetical protein
LSWRSWSCPCNLYSTCRNSGGFPRSLKLPCWGSFILFYPESITISSILIAVQICANPILPWGQPQDTFLVNSSLMFQKLKLLGGWHNHSPLWIFLPLFLCLITLCISSLII